MAEREHDCDCRVCDALADGLTALADEWEKRADGVEDPSLHRCIYDLRKLLASTQGYESNKEDA